ncbi:MAG: B-box zinc finger protein [Anaerolineae bacterium]|nr:B-box zinc finger protein [Anaerolineae bacterium]
MIDANQLPSADGGLTYCAVHPDRETSLRCNKCGRLMCAECAVLTPVGYRCRECVRGHQERFLKASRADNVIVFVVCALLSGVMLALVKLLPIPLIFLLLLGLPAGGLVAELAFRAVGRRRSRYLGEIAAAGAALGAVLGMAVGVAIAVNGRIPSLEALFQALIRDWPALIFAAMIAGAVYVRLRVKF